ncbi:MAG: hypothetical protein ABIC40_05435 [bacterium]
MEYKIRVFICLPLILTGLMFGCSTEKHPADAVDFSPNLQSIDYPTPVIEADSQNSHGLWGFWWIMLNPSEKTWQIVPARNMNLHLNIRTYLEDGPLCTNCLKITSFKDGPDGSKLIDIRITHPWPGMNNLTGFDVRAIAMLNGSETWGASGLVTQDPYGTDGYVVNADGYTSIFNPVDFPYNPEKPVLTYSKGKFATPTAPNSTLNPYIDYFTHPNRHFFAAGLWVSKTWQIKFPSGDPLVLGYAVDCSWKKADITPPQILPDDFPIEANRPESYKIETTQVGTLLAGIDQTGKLEVEAWDWQMDPDNAWVECPELWDGKVFHTSVTENPDSFTYKFDITNETGASDGKYRALIGVEDSTSAKPPFDNTAYSFFEIQVSLDCCLEPPVAQFGDFPTDVITGQEFTIISTSYDPESPDCPVESWWDIDGDGFYDDGTGEEIITSFDEVGDYEVKLMALDECSMANLNSIVIHVHPGVTKLEDQAAKSPNLQYSALSKDMTVDDAAFAVDMNNPDGPWDFTALPLENVGSYFAVLPTNHPEVNEFKDDLLSPFTQVIKYNAFYDLGFGTVQGLIYVAERYALNPDRLLLTGAYDPYHLGTVNFIPAIQSPFPLWIFTDNEVIFDNAPVLVMHYTDTGWGEGLVTVPAPGMTNLNCVVIRTELIMDGFQGLADLIVFRWYSDDGKMIASVSAGNYDPYTNWDPDTHTITGVATFNAVSKIVPY